jgi:Holliday junction resolvase RusA-like endonuclease
VTAALTQLELFLPGPPLMRREPKRAANGRMYPDPKTTRGLLAWQYVWAQAGRVFVPGPIVLELYVRCTRPPSHLSRSGLSAAGKRWPYPPTFDVSNCLKLVEDALKGKAMPDDSHVVAIHACKSWVGVGDERAPGSYLSLRTAYSTIRDD